MQTKRGKHGAAFKSLQLWSNRSSVPIRASSRTRGSVSVGFRRARSFEERAGVRMPLHEAHKTRIQPAFGHDAGKKHRGGAGDRQDLIRLFLFLESAGDGGICWGRTNCAAGSHPVSCAFCREALSPLALRGDSCPLTPGWFGVAGCCPGALPANPMQAPNSLLWKSPSREHWERRTPRVETKVAQASSL
jgi:hypothetical protein